METYVDREVKPHIQHKASDMAHQLQTFIDILMPTIPTRALAVVIKDVVPCEDAISSLPNHATTQADPFKEPMPRINFRQDMKNIFESALKWRAEKHAKIYENYFFRFPSLGSKYVRSNMAEEEVDDDGNPRDRKVILCLWPITYRTVLERLMGSFTPPEKIVNGVVV